MPPGRAALLIWGFVLGPTLGVAIGFAAAVTSGAFTFGWPAALTVGIPAVSTAVVGLCLRRPGRELAAVSALSSATTFTFLVVVAYAIFSNFD